jgi:hypothetical protein
MIHLFHWVHNHWNAVGDVILIWVVPVAVVYLSNKLFSRGLSL